MRARPYRRQGLDVGQDELGDDGLDVACGLDLTVDVDDVRVVEGSGDHADGVGLADVGEELVAQALALARSPHDAGDVDEGDGGGQDPFGAEDLGEGRQARVRQGNDADVGLDGGEGVVRREHGRTGEGVEQGGLADVGQSDDSDGKGHARSLSVRRRRPGPALGHVFVSHPRVILVP